VRRDESSDAGSGSRWDSVDTFTVTGGEEGELRVTEAPSQLATDIDAVL
jgi:hypothetical protein